jgi:hypothetical protein
MTRDSGPPPASPANPRAAAFHEAVARAEAAIRGHLAGRIRFRSSSLTGSSSLTPQAAVSRLREMAEAGTPPTPELLAALTEALESDVKPRRRGRPPGQRGTHESVSAAWAGLRALAGSPLPLYGAPYGPGYSQCAAVALAMQRCGFKQCATPAAVANLARQWHRRLRAMRPLADALAQFAAPGEVTAALARIAKADFSSIINGLGLFQKSGN